MNVQDKVVIVTGASSGIGLATAQLLAKQGAKVTLVARSKDKLDQISQGLPDSFVIVADLSKEDEVKQMVQKTFDHFGRIDILVNNAGRGYDSLVEKIETDKYRQLFELNLVAPLVGMQEVIPIMKKQGQGVIVNISSGTVFMDIPRLGAYSSLKRALSGLSLTARAELKDQGISVCVVYPYITATNFYQNKFSESKTGDKERYHQGGDSPEVVAKKVLEAIQTEQAETKVRNFG